MGKHRNIRRQGIAKPSRRVYTLVAVALACVAVASVAIAYRVVTRSGRFEFSQIHVSGAVHAKPVEIEALLAHHKGESLLSLRMDQIENLIKEHPWIKAAHATRKFPHAIDIKIEEHEASFVALVRNVPLLVTEDGAFIKVGNVATGETQGLPVLSGVTAEDDNEVTVQVTQGRALIERYEAVREDLPPLDTLHTWHAGISIWTQKPLVAIHISRGLQGTAFAQAVRASAQAWSTLSAEEQSEIREIFVNGKGQPERVVMSKSVRVGKPRG